MIQSEHINGLTALAAFFGALGWAFFMAWRGDRRGRRAARAAETADRRFLEGRRPR